MTRYKAIILLICIAAALMFTGCARKGTPAAPAVQDGNIPGDDAQVIGETQKRIEVGTVQEFYEAIGPDREIVLQPGVYLLSELKDEKETNPHVLLFNRLGDVELTIQGVENLSIAGLGEKPVEFLSQPRNANIMVFNEVKGIKLSNLRIGHSPEKSICSEGVLKLNS
ncbi:MAG: hypothetical protein HPY66_3115 [Firmicutes bacterium]|nr:hypothetical protein [Bacillota bacterium]MDI6706824.1 hypothetical protein [Bacillota bacterium]